MEVVGFGELDLWILVGDLGLGYQQMVEIVCNLIGSCCCLILDEFMVMLINCEVELLFLCIECLCVEGVVIIYILYWLEELKCIVDCIVVLCDGKLVCNDDIGCYFIE